MEKGIRYERSVRMVWVPKSTLAGTDDGTDGEHGLVETKDDSSKMSRGSFLDVELREGEKKTRRKYLKVENQ